MKLFDDWSKPLVVSNSHIFIVDWRFGFVARRVSQKHLASSPDPWILEYSRIFVDMIEDRHTRVDLLS